MNDERVVAEDLEPPGLRVVAAGGPAGEVEDLLDLRRSLRQLAALCVGQRQGGGDVPLDHFQLQALQRVVVPQVEAPADELAPVGIELMGAGSGAANPAAAGR